GDNRPNDRKVTVEARRNATTKTRRHEELIWFFSCLRAFVAGLFVARLMYADLTDFLADLDRRKLLARIAEPVSPDLEIATVTDRACKSPGGGPALLFTQPTGYDIPVATNIYGSTERMCLALGVKSLDDLAKEIDELMTPQMPEGIIDALKMLPMVGRLRDLMPKTVKDAPCHEIVQRDGTLDALPILKCWSCG